MQNLGVYDQNLFDPPDPSLICILISRKLIFWLISGTLNFLGNCNWCLAPTWRDFLPPLFKELSFLSWCEEKLRFSKLLLYFCWLSQRRFEHLWYQVVHRPSSDHSSVSALLPCFHFLPWLSDIPCSVFDLCFALSSFPKVFSSVLILGLRSFCQIDFSVSFSSLALALQLPCLVLTWFLSLNINAGTNALCALPLWFRTFLYYYFSILIIAQVWGKKI